MEVFDKYAVHQIAVVKQTKSVILSHTQHAASSFSLRQTRNPLVEDMLGFHAIRRGAKFTRKCAFPGSTSFTNKPVTPVPTSLLKGRFPIFIFQNSFDEMLVQVFSHILKIRDHCVSSKSPGCGSVKSRACGDWLCDGESQGNTCSTNSISPLPQRLSKRVSCSTRQRSFPKRLSDCTFPRAVCLGCSSHIANQQRRHQNIGLCARGCCQGRSLQRFRPRHSTWNP